MPHINPDNPELGHPTFEEMLPRRLRRTSPAQARRLGGPLPGHMERETSNVPIRLGGIFGGISEAIRGAGAIAQQIGNFGRPTAMVPVQYPGPQYYSPHIMPSYTAPSSPTVNQPVGPMPSIWPGWVGQPGRPDATLVRSNLEERRRFQFGDIDSPGTGTGPQKRDFILRTIAYETFGRKTLSYSAFKRIVRDLGPENAQEYMNLDDSAMWTVLANPPKRRGPFISARIVNRACSTLRRAERITKNCKTPTRRRRTASRRTSVTQIKQ